MPIAESFNDLRIKMHEGLEWSRAQNRQDMIDEYTAALECLDRIEGLYFRLLPECPADKVELVERMLIKVIQIIEEIFAKTV